MKSRTPSLVHFVPSLAFGLLAALLFILWLAGGSARGDVLGQAVVRTISCAALVIWLLLGRRPEIEGVRIAVVLLAAVILLPLLQLIPLPPGLWASIPGRDLLTQASALSDGEEVWRPLSITPGATMNAAASLLVPAVVLALMLGIQQRERMWLVGLLLLLVGASTLLGLLQVSGSGFDNPLVNDVVGDVSGTFANRNHFALLVAIGCLIVPIWCFQKGGHVGWRGPVALGLIVLFALMILVSGSRAGMALGGLAILIGLMLVRKRIEGMLSRFPKWVKPVAFVLVAFVIVGFVMLSFSSDRAESINRLIDQDIGADMRSRGMETLVAMLRDYNWAGYGFGAFDQAFRIHERDAVLQFQYFNHAHNDFLEVVMEGGLAALLILAASVIWWGICSLRIWRAPSSDDVLLGRAGSAILLLIFGASLVDYPARTPLVMAVTVIATLWLAWGNASTRQRSPLPGTSA